MSRSKVSRWSHIYICSLSGILHLVDCVDKLSLLADVVTELVDIPYDLHLFNLESLGAGENVGEVFLQNFAYVVLL